MADIYINSNQSVQDLAIQGTGSIEYMFELALLNGFSITELPEPGMRIITPLEKETGMFEYYQKKRLIPVTGQSKTTPGTQHLFHPGLFEYGLFE